MNVRCRPLHGACMACSHFITLNMRRSWAPMPQPSLACMVFFSDRADGSFPPQSPDRELELIGKGRQEHTFAYRGFGGTRRDGTEGGCGRRFLRADEGGRWRGWGRAKH